MKTKKVYVLKWTEETKVNRNIGFDHHDDWKLFNTLAATSGIHDISISRKSICII